MNAERGRAAAGARAAEQAAAAARAELHTQQARVQRLLDDNHVLAQDKMMVMMIHLPNAPILVPKLQLKLLSHITVLIQVVHICKSKITFNS